MDELRLDMRNIKKHFGGVKALDGVSFSVRPGEVHALVGENGAGKSTLMKVLSGAYQKDEGEIYIDGKPAQITSPKEAKELGVAVVYQEFMLAPDLTVAENIFIDRLSKGRSIINWKELRKSAQEELSKLGFSDISPAVKVGTLSVAHQQVVEICKCLTRNAKVLVLDEPTAVLTFSEIEKLFGIIERLKAENVSVIYISHRLEEIFRISDNITILKDGGYVGTMATKDVDKQRVINKMVGRPLSTMFPPRSARIGEVVLSVSGLSTAGFVRDISFEAHAGEVLGFSGLVGSGRTEIMKALFGIAKKQADKIVYLGKEVDFRHPQEAKDGGLGYLPEDRKKEGLLLNQSIKINTTMPIIKRITTKTGILKKKREEEYVKNILADLATKYGGIEDNVSSLSGGNQQKVALAKWVGVGCKCIILDEPTRGVDVGAKIEIYNIINKLAEEGVAIIMISSEMPEIIGMCDRVIVMRQGMITGEVDKESLSEQELINYSMGG